MNAAAASAAPVTTVLAQFEAGASSLVDISERTGLDIDLVRQITDRLVAMGRVSAERVGSGCPDGACGGCGWAGADGSPCSPGPFNARGPVFLTLVPRA